MILNSEKFGYRCCQGHIQTIRHVNFFHKSNQLWITTCLAFNRMVHYTTSYIERWPLVTGLVRCWNVAWWSGTRGISLQKIWHTFKNPKIPKRSKNLKKSQKKFPKSRENSTWFWRSKKSRTLFWKWFAPEIDFMTAVSFSFSFSPTESLPSNNFYVLFSKLKKEGPYCLVWH